MLAKGLSDNLVPVLQHFRHGLLTSAVFYKDVNYTSRPSYILLSTTRSILLGAPEPQPFQRAFLRHLLLHPDIRLSPTAKDLVTEHPWPLFENL